MPLYGNYAYKQNTLLEHTCAILCRLLMQGFYVHNIAMCYVTISPNKEFLNIYGKDLQDALPHN